MKTYQLSALVTVSIYTKIEAESLEEAIEKSKEREIQKFVYGNSGQSEECWVCDDFDGEPKSITEG